MQIFIHPLRHHRNSVEDPAQTIHIVSRRSRPFSNSTRCSEFVVTSTSQRFCLERWASGPEPHAGR
ncbi:hypothetical protein SCLCIDRAFT_675929 [Scleroderma citrinum Foug A]|uniref:Uncharacterized protein n=1 Tax=Scleroderma citrinum Foug A TaxID=1036808 RepID=A0A0C3AGB0_9AGAM|nr:hypothetical protein SCLCIDRAFT_675929 [Scleroderma citrinum Foug A]